MGKEGYRKVQSHGQVTLPKFFRDRHDLGKGDKIYYKEHSRDKSKLIITVEEGRDS